MGWLGRVELVRPCWVGGALLWWVGGAIVAKRWLSGGVGGDLDGGLGYGLNCGQYSCMGGGLAGCQGVVAFKVNSEQGPFFAATFIWLVA